MIDSPTIYSTYNARMLSPEEIARTFVINDAYRKLLRVEHSILRGPRGTGKTTLLKMLTPRALKEWGDREKYNVPPRL
jgi:predicted AAA+ superfamily ATPase